MACLITYSFKAVDLCVQAGTFTQSGYFAIPHYQHCQYKW